MSDGKSASLSFIDACLAGMATPEMVDNWIEVWHRGDVGGELHEALGMTEEEYGNWMVAPSCLEHVIEIQRLRRNALEVLRNMTQSPVSAPMGVVLSFPVRQPEGPVA